MTLMDGPNAYDNGVDKMKIPGQDASTEDETSSQRGEDRRDNLMQSLMAEMEAYSTSEMVKETREHQHILVSEEKGNEEDGARNQLEAFILARAKDRRSSESDDPSYRSDPESEPSFVNSDQEKNDEYVEDRSQLLKVPSAEEMEANRQRTLRDVAIHDRIGGDYLPKPRIPTELYTKLQKRREEAIRYAREIRAPFEKFQDFDAFIDEVTITDDQSWKTIHIDTKHAS